MTASASIDARKSKSIYKAIFLGCFLIPFNSYWVMTIEMGRYLAYPTCISLFLNVVFTLICSASLESVSCSVIAPARFYVPRPAYYLHHAISASVIALVIKF